MQGTPTPFTPPTTNILKKTSFLQKIRLYFHTLKFVYPFQIYKRLFALIQTRFLSYSPLAFSQADFADVGIFPQTPFLHHEFWNEAEKLKEGKFCFLNRTVDLGLPVCWNTAEQSLLWRFHLHYFHFLHLLEPEGQRQIAQSWIDANPVGTLGWHSYPLSLRIVNWCKANLTDPKCLESLFVQADFLFHHLETYHPANHLLENAKALIFAGVFFKRSAHGKLWLRRGLDILRQETPKQVLSDGGYFERSPMYHALMLEAYLDIINLLKDQADDFIATAKQMSTFLQALTHPNGLIALFNDSTHEVAPPTKNLLAYALRLIGSFPSQDCFEETGFWTYRHDDFYFVIKAGQIAPNHIPAHAHADLFSYELSVAGEQIVVDAGVFEYQAGQMRDYVRATRSHNTFCVNQTNQAECWASFRVARRYPPKNVIWKADKEGFRFAGEFWGYSQLIGGHLKCKRQIHCSVKDKTFEVTDTFEGTGTFLVESMIHFQHELTIFQKNENQAVIQGKQARVLLTSKHLSQEPTWRCPQFGTIHESTAFAVSANQRLPAKLQYALQF